MQLEYVRLGMINDKVDNRYPFVPKVVSGAKCFRCGNAVEAGKTCLCRNRELVNGK